MCHRLVTFSDLNDVGDVALVLVTLQSMCHIITSGAADKLVLYCW